MKKTISIFAIISIAFYISVFLFFGIRYKLSYTHNLNQIRSHFKELRILISSIYSATNSFNSNYFKKRIHQTMKKDRYLKLVMISNNQGQIEYLYTKDKSLINKIIFSEPEININKTKPSTLFRLRFPTDTCLKTPLLPINNTTYQLYTIYRIISYPELYKLIKDMFYTFVAFFIVVFIFSLYSLTATDKTVRSSGTSYQMSSSQKATSMYSPISGIIWREYLDVRLEEELRNADIKNSNLSLAIITIDDFDKLEHREEVYLALVKMILNRFPNKNLIFEWEKGVAVILPDTEIEEAIKKMEKLRENIIDKYYETHRFSVSIGISAKNNRDISSTRLIKETSLSLKKAINEGKNQVIAFNADPQKYAKMQHIS